MTINQDINSSNICQLKFLSLNVCGLVSKSNYPEFLDLIRNYGIIGIQESKTDACDSINIPGYNIYFNNRENLSRRKSGGIVLLVYFSWNLQPRAEIFTNFAEYHNIIKSS